MGFADDVAIIGTEYTTWLLEETINAALDQVKTWMESNGVTHSKGKSAVVILIINRPTFELHGEDIILIDEIWYMGVELNFSMGFR